jgi:hypothetical protein
MVPLLVIVLEDWSTPETATPVSTVRTMTIPTNPNLLNLPLNLIYWADLKDMIIRFYGKQTTNHGSFNIPPVNV